MEYTRHTPREHTPDEVRDILTNEKLYNLAPIGEIDRQRREHWREQIQLHRENLDQSKQPATAVDTEKVDKDQKQPGEQPKPEQKEPRVLANETPTVTHHIPERYRRAIDLSNEHNNERPHHEREHRNFKRVQDFDR